jgi:phospholipase D1/2
MGQFPGVRPDHPPAVKRGLDVRFAEALQARALRRMRKGSGAGLFVGSPGRPRAALPDRSDDQDTCRVRLHGAPLNHVHAKVSVFDDTSAIVSSANLDSRSLLWDTEAGIYLTNRNDVTELRHRVMSHWLPKDAAPDAFEGTTAVSAWTRITWANAEKRSADRSGLLLPLDFASAEVFGRNLPIPPTEIG